MRRTPVAALALALALLLAACGGAPAAPTAGPAAAPTGAITVFAAASLTEAFSELGKAFEAANPGATVTFNFAGSQQLVAQLNGGAPADVFASANAAQMKAAVEGGRVTAGSDQTFVRNKLVVVMPKDNPAGIQSLADLARPGLKIVLADKAVPVGQYSLDFLQKASALPEYTSAYSAAVLSSVVSFEENVKAVVAKVSLGEADAGIVYATDAAAVADKLGQLAIPNELNSIASYPIAPVADSASPRLTDAFLAFVLGPEGQGILAKYGFAPADE